MEWRQGCFEYLNIGALTRSYTVLWVLLQQPSVFKNTVLRLLYNSKMKEQERFHKKTDLDREQKCKDCHVQACSVNSCCCFSGLTTTCKSHLHLLFVCALYIPVLNVFCCCCCMFTYRFWSFWINPAGETPAGSGSPDDKTNVSDTTAVLSSQSNLTFSSQQLPFLTSPTYNSIKRDVFTCQCSLYDAL